MIYEEIRKCRICGNPKLIEVLNLGNQALTGVFPAKNQEIPSGPLVLVKCDDYGVTENCGLLQLKYGYDTNLLYSDSYGYRSGLNKSMVRHLHAIVKKIEENYALKDNDLIVDIASNDGTLLSAYQNTNLQLLGIDPTSKKFEKYYPAHVQHISKFFSAENLRTVTNDKAKVITSIAMFYDLSAPLDFVRDIYEVLDDEGVWILEQSYMPTMIQNVSYDTVCHEHLEYYALKQIKWLADQGGFKIVDIELNDANGGSFCLTLAKREASFTESPDVMKILEEEKAEGYSDLGVYKKFEQKTEKHRQDLIAFLKDLRSQGKRVFGYGASTKGNVILQYCNLTSTDIPYIAEVNEDKFGKFTPSTNIPIISETEAKKMRPDYFLVLPWHFKDNIIEREADFLSAGNHLLFPLPKLTVI